jgi:hypothetical protein
MCAIYSDSTHLSSQALVDEETQAVDLASSLLLVGTRTDLGAGHGRCRDSTGPGYGRLRKGIIGP